MLPPARSPRHQSGAEGIFRFNSLVPATYTLTIQASQGFKTYTQANIDVTASEVRDLGQDRALASAPSPSRSPSPPRPRPIQTASAENSKLIDSSQMSNITLKGRDLFGMMVTLPGVAVTQRDTTSENTVGSVRINGAQFASANFTVDGITNLDTGSNGTSHFEPNMDSIAEMRVLTSNYQAEYGRNSNGVISIVTKGGSQEFHGSAWANKRHEMFNAKNFFDNYNGRQKSLYRFFVWGYSIGGPVYIPKLFNTKKQKLFFFWSQEYTKQKPGTQIGIRQHADRRHARGRLLRLHRHQRRACSPHRSDHRRPDSEQQHHLARGAESRRGQGRPGDARRPAACRISAAAPASPPPAASWTPTPSQTFARNYYWSFNETHPRRNDVVRVDYNITSKLNTWVRYINDYDLDTAAPTAIASR